MQRCTAAATELGQPEAVTALQGDAPGLTGEGARSVATGGVSGVQGRTCSWTWGGLKKAVRQVRESMRFWRASERGIASGSCEPVTMIGFRKPVCTHAPTHPQGTSVRPAADGMPRIVPHGTAYCHRTACQLYSSGPPREYETEARASGQEARGAGGMRSCCVLCLLRPSTTGRPSAGGGHGPLPPLQIAECKLSSEHDQAWRQGGGGAHEHEAEGGGGVRHGVRAVDDEEAVIHLAVPVQHRGELLPFRGPHVRGVLVVHDLQVEVREGREVGHHVEDVVQQRAGAQARRARLPCTHACGRGARVCGLEFAARARATALQSRLDRSIWSRKHLEPWQPV